MLRRTSLLSAIVSLMLLPALALAQDQNQGGRDRGEGRRNFDPAQMRERMMANMREQLGATDEEWQVLSPKIEKVFTAQRDARMGGMGFWAGRRGRDGGGPGGPGGPDSSEPQSPVARAVIELRDTLANKDAPTDLIAQKLTALREAREKAQADLQAAQKDLKDVLTQRQEAALVMMGMLE